MWEFPVEFGRLCELLLMVWKTRENRKHHVCNHMCGTLVICKFIEVLVFSYQLEYEQIVKVFFFKFLNLKCFCVTVYYNIFHKNKLLLLFILWSHWELFNRNKMELLIQPLWRNNVDTSCSWGIFSNIKNLYLYEIVINKIVLTQDQYQYKVDHNYATFTHIWCQSELCSHEGQGNF